MASAFEDFLGKKWGEALLAWAKTSLAGKVDKISGKGLSANDLTTELKKSYDGAVTDVANLKKVGAEKNTIVGIKVNGTVQTPDSNRQVDISVPTDSDIADKVEGYGYQTESQVNTLIVGKGYQTAGQVDDAIVKKGYQTAAQVNTAITNKGYATKAEVDKAIKDTFSKIKQWKYLPVESLPTVGEEGIIYLVPHAHGDKDNHDEYVWIESLNTYEKLGHSDIELSGYVKVTDIVVLTDKDFEAMLAG